MFAVLCVLWTVFCCPATVPASGWAGGVGAVGDGDAPVEDTVKKPWRPTHFVFLDTGEGDRSGTSPEQLRTLQAEHLGNLARLAREDKSRLAGPLGRESKKTRGIVILSLPDGVDVESEFALDPFMHKRFLAVRAYPWSMSTGVLREPTEVAALGEYVTVVVEKSDGSDRAAAMTAYRALEKELASWSMANADADSGATPDPGAAASVLPLALAGSVESSDSTIGIMIFRIGDLDRVRRAMDDSGAFQGGTVRYDAYRQYLGAGLID